MIKQVRIDPTIGHGYMTDVYGGTELQVSASSELSGLIIWWRKWGPLFNSRNPAVQASIEDMYQQLITMERMGTNQSN